MADDYSNNILASLAGLQGAGSVASGWAQAQALNAQADFAVSMARVNQRFAQYRADDVLKQGDIQADRIRQQGLKVQGAQRAGAAAQGIRVDDGSASEAVETTRELSADDQITTRNNAWREAYGIQQQARANVEQAKLQQSGAKAAASGTLLGGALGGLSSVGRMSNYLNTNRIPKRQPETLMGSGTRDVSSTYEAPPPGETNDGFNAWWKE